MYIVGTSGHIDHGKTSLIRALTGIDCDRLPEEKKREMTIDIGFAYIDYPGFGTISIIDVPGHERFIRNMVAGAWGIDLALLVIAVDDGWMPQTEDHFNVLELLGIERIIVVLNKIDIADEEIIGIVTEEVQERLKDTPYKDADIAKVSSKTGQGIEDLKKTIKKNIDRLSAASDAGKPYLYIDRIFGAKGHGTVITGTLKNGRFTEDELVTVLPGNTEARIKKIESHNVSLSKGNLSQRTALNLSGVSSNELHRGHIIVSRNFYTESNDIFAVIQLLDKKRDIRNNLGIEVLIGTSSQKAKVILIDDTKENPADKYVPVRIKFDNPWFFFPGEPFIITNPGGYRIIGGGKVIFPSYSKPGIKTKLKENYKILSKFTPDEIIEFILKINPGIKKQDLISQLPYNSKIVEKILSSGLEKDLVQINDFIMDKKFYDNAVSMITDIINNNIGLNVKEISDLSGTGMEVCEIILNNITAESGAVEKDGRYFSGSSITVGKLSNDMQKSLSSVKDNGSDGIEIDKLKDDKFKKNIKELVKLGFLISLDGNIIYHSEIYENLKKNVMSLFDNHDKITIAEVRDITELSRKYLIPLLNRIERDGLIKRIGDFRMKA